MKVNTDAGELGALGTGMGVVCRGSNGDLVACASIKSPAKWEPRIAEAMAVYEGLLVAKMERFSHVVVESDCLAVIQALKANHLGSSDFHLVLEDIISLLSSFVSVVWSFVKRSGNRVAHELAHFLPVEGDKRVWKNDFPASIVSLAIDDLMQ